MKTENIAAALNWNRTALESGLARIERQLAERGIQIPTQEELHALVREAAEVEGLEVDLMRRVAESAITSLLILAPGSAL
jgi:hypothetical protein